MFSGDDRPTAQHERELNRAERRARARRNPNDGRDDAIREGRKRFAARGGAMPANRHGSSAGR